MKAALQLFLLLICARAFAQGANVIPFQGQLANQAGQPLSPSNAVTVVFRLYRVPVGGVAIWEESQSNISVNAGRFSVLLGSRTELPGPTNFNTTLYLGLTVDDGNPATADVEMRPRQALVPVISASYAKLAQNSEKLNGFDWTALFGSNDPSDNLLGSRIAESTITSNQIAPQTLTAAQIAPATITSNQIAVGTITSKQIADGTIDVSDLAQQVLSKLVPVGTVVPFAGPQDRVPALEASGWLLCDGRRVRKADYPDLWQMILDHWGQADTDTFVLPDLRGVFLRGVDLSIHTSAPGTNVLGGVTSGRDPEGDTRTYWGGTGGRQVGTFQGESFLHHKHKDADLSPTLEGFSSWDTSSIRNSPVNASGVRNYTSEEGGNETRPKNAYVNYIIKY